MKIFFVRIPTVISKERWLIFNPDNPTESRMDYNPAFDTFFKSSFFSYYPAAH